MQRRDTTSSNGSKAISSVDIIGNATSTTWIDDGNIP